MPVITVNLTEEQLDWIHYLVSQGIYPSRNELIRTAIRKLIAEEIEKLDIKRMMLGVRT